MRISFDVPPEALQWIEVDAGNVVTDTSDDEHVDAVWRGALVRNVLVGQPLEYHLRPLPEGAWQTFGAPVASVT